MRTSRRVSVAWLALCLAAVLASGAGGSGSVAQTGTRPPSSTPTSGGWREPGLVDGDGQPVDVVPPAPATGRELLVTDFGADPEPDSGDDAPAIRAAFDEAREGDTVVLPEGVFDLRSSHPANGRTHVLLKSGVHLRGAGPDRTLLVSDFDRDDASAVLLARGVEDVVIADLTVTSTYDGPFGSNPLDDTAGGGPMFGIMITERDGEPSVRVLVEDVRVERFQRHGISLKATRQVIVRGCYVADATSIGPGGAGYGIAVEGRADQRDPEASNDSRHNVITDNVLNGEHLRHAILLQFPTHNNLIADNLVSGSVLDAIDLHGESEYLNEIRGNTVSGVIAGAAIALGNPGGGTNGHDASGEGNWVHHNDLIANLVGIAVILGTPDTLIEANRIIADEDSEVGILIDDAPGTVVRDNILVSSGGFEPFRVNEEDVEIADNQVEGHGGVAPRVIRGRRTDPSIPSGCRGRSAGRPGAPVRRLSRPTDHPRQRVPIETGLADDLKPALLIEGDVRVCAGLEVAGDADGIRA